MLLNKLKSVVALLLMLGLCAPALIAQKPTPPGLDEVTGRFKAVDTEKNTLTLTIPATKNSPGEDKTFDLTKDAKVVIESRQGKLLVESKEAKLADLSSKMMVTITLKDAKVILIRATDDTPLESFSGVLKATNGDKNTITLTIPGSERQPQEDRTFDVAMEAKIVGDQIKPAKLADLPIGSQIVLTVSKDRKVIGIVASGPTVIGTLKTVDTGKNTITLTVPTVKGSPPEERTFEVAKEARIGINKTQVVKLGDLPVDTQISLTLSLDQKNALTIAARGSPETSGIRGVLSSLDLTKNSITLSISKGKGQPTEDQTYLIPKEAKIGINLEKHGKLSDLKVGAMVTVEITATQKIVSLQAVGPTITGILKAIDPDKCKITLIVNITEKSTGEDKEFSVSKDAKFSIRKVQIDKLLDLAIGSRMTLTLSLDEKTVIRGSAEPQ